MVAQRHGTEGTEAAWHGTKQRTLALELMAIWPFLSVKAKFLDHSAAWGKSMSGMMCFMFFFLISLPLHRHLGNMCSYIFMGED
jgi:hypothetical protein